MSYSYDIESIRKLCRVVGAAVMTVASQPSEATPQLINLSSLSDTGVSIPSLLGIGEYRIDFANMSTGGAHDAWNPWGRNSGCNANGEKCRQGWQAGYAIEFTNLEGKKDGVRVYLLNDGRNEPAYFSTPGAANAAYQNGPLSWTKKMNPSEFVPSDFVDVPTMGFTLKEPAYARFFVPDSTYRDNTGGVSLFFEAGGPLDPKTPVIFAPEPPYWANLNPATIARQVHHFSPLGQSFIAVEDHLDNIGFAFQVFNQQFGEVPVTISLLSGEGLGGALIAQRSITPSGPSISDEWYKKRVLSFADFGGTPLTVGVAYTALIATTNAYWGIEMNDDNPYADGIGYYSLGGTLSSNLKSDFTFAINVPEPASWALMIVGFGLVGVSMRRSKVAIAA
jgi:hypothetical protein